VGLVGAVGAWGLARVGSASRQADTQAELNRLQGTWRVVAAQIGGEAAPEDQFRNVRYTIAGSQMTLREGEGPGATVTIALDLGSDPAKIDITDATGERTAGIYRLDPNGALTLCYVKGSQTRPRAFDSAPDPSGVVLVLERVTE